jgi:CMP-N,N'-diacetyllegionaminic acid synthase
MSKMLTNNKTVVAIIPARGGSKGIPRKNLKMLAGQPLVAHAITAALGSPLVTRVVVNSEDPEIREVAASFGAETQNRPVEFWYDETVQEVDRLLMWSVRDLEDRGAIIDVIALVYPTAPLRQAEHITATVDLVINRGFDSALTLCKYNDYLWRVSPDGIAAPINYDPSKRGPHQKEHWNQWVENKAVYAMRRDLLMETGCRLGGRIGYVAMSKRDSIDIDDPEDLEIAAAIMATHSI